MDYGGTLTGRAVVNDSPEGLEIVIPAPRVWPAIAFLGLWLAGWVTGEVFALRQILTPAPVPAKAFLAVWLTFWTVGGTAALSACVWMLAGHERVRLRPDALTIQREAFGLGPTRRYELDRVRNLAAQALPPLTVVAGARGAPGPALDEATAAHGARTVVSVEQAGAVMRVLGIGGPGIAFAYGGRPVRFGLALDPTEARLVVSQLRARHSFPSSEAPAA